jgi:RNA recognition motif-containing protein
MASRDPTWTVVFVTDLARQADRARVRELFAAYGDVVDCRFSDPLRPGQAARAFVSYRTHEQAQAMIRECNYRRIDGMAIHVMWYTKQERDPAAQLVITNLAPSVEEAELHAALEDYADLDVVRIFRPAASSAAIAYVQFPSADAARAAHRALQGFYIAERPVTVDFFRSINVRQNLPRKLPPRFIAVQAEIGVVLPSHDILAQLFSPFGEICDIFDVPDHAVIYFRDADAAKDAAGIADSRLRVSSSLPSALQRQIWEVLERRRVFVCDITESGMDGLPALLGTVGCVAELSLLSNAAIVQYNTAEARNQALAVIDGKIPDGQLTPIHVAPFVDKRLDHPMAGLLQLNELEPCEPSEIRALYSAFGTIAAVAIAPAFGFVVGFVLFEQFANAQRAHDANVARNCFLHQPIQSDEIHDVLSFFSDKLRGRWLAVRELNGRGAAAVVAAVGPGAQSAWFAENGTAYILFPDRQSLHAGVEKLSEQGRRFDILSNFLLFQSGKMLNRSYRGFHERLLFISGLPRKTGNRELRETFEKFGPVDGAMVAVHIDTGMPVGKGVVLFAQQAHAIKARRTPLLLGASGAPLLVTEFRGKDDRRPVARQEEEVKVKQAVIPRVRDYLKGQIQGKADPDQIERLFNGVGSLSLNEVYIFLAHPDMLDDWVARILE